MGAEGSHLKNSENSLASRPRRSSDTDVPEGRRWVQTTLTGLFCVYNCLIQSSPPSFFPTLFQSSSTKICLKPALLNSQSGLWLGQALKRCTPDSGCDALSGCSKMHSVQGLGPRGNMDVDSTPSSATNKLWALSKPRFPHLYVGDNYLRGLQ